MRQEDRIPYCRACWETFCSDHGIRRFGMSPAEFRLACQWFDAAIPLPVVLRGIHETGGQPRTLLACEEPVKRAAGYWRDAMRGTL